MAQRSGNKVKVVTYSFYENSFYDQEYDGILSREFIFEGIPIIAFKLKCEYIGLNIHLKDESLYGFAKKIIDDESPDIIHIGHPMRVHEFIKVAIEKRIPYILTLTDFFMMCPKVNLAPDKYTLCSGPQRGSECRILCAEFNDRFISHRLDLAENYLKNAEQIVSPSKFLAVLFSQEFSGINIQIINHGLRYKFIKQNNRIYKGGVKLVFGCAGTLAYHKGVHILLKAFASIENRDVELKIYGSGEKDYTSYLRNITSTDKRVTFCGTYLSEQLGEIFSGIDVMIVPSVCYENYPFVLHEALASNVPVIASNIGGMAEKIKDNFNGLTFNTGSFKDLMRKMTLIIEHPDILNKMKANIKNQIVIPTVEQEAYNYLQLYKRTLLKKLQFLGNS